MIIAVVKVTAVVVVEAEVVVVVEVVAEANHLHQKIITIKRDLDPHPLKTETEIVLGLLLEIKTETADLAEIDHLIIIKIDPLHHLLLLTTTTSHPPSQSLLLDPVGQTIGIDPDLDQDPGIVVETDLLETKREIADHPETEIGTEVKTGIEIEIGTDHLQNMEDHPNDHVVVVVVVNLMIERIIII